MTHAKLVKKARAWLFRRHALVVSEMNAGRETPDALGISRGYSTLIECKTSRADFLNDKNKFFRRNREFGMGNLRYYLTPKGLVLPDELPMKWGLLELHGERIFEIRTAERLEKDVQAEISLLISIIRRTRPSLDDVSIKFYNIPTKNRSTVILNQGNHEEAT